MADSNTATVGIAPQTLAISRATFDVGVVVGRFQVPDLHAAHRALIQTVCDQHDKVLVVLGVSPLRATTQNPLDFEARKQMILAEFPHVTVLPVKDSASDHVWSRRLDEVVGDFLAPVADSGALRQPRLVRRALPRTASGAGAGAGRASVGDGDASGGRPVERARKLRLPGGRRAGGDEPLRTRASRPSTSPSTTRPAAGCCSARRPTRTAGVSSVALLTRARQPTRLTRVARWRRRPASRSRTRSTWARS